MTGSHFTRYAIGRKKGRAGFPARPVLVKNAFASLSHGDETTMTRGQKLTEDRGHNRLPSMVEYALQPESFQLVEFKKIEDANSLLTGDLFTVTTADSLHGCL